ncbi:hypothetical protein M407DRAFT_22771 [Tulasnella calospora MUT 4182]|uniref:Major facilitator superfamily (MFS) profile domain-containing protein n=1 Tax=Tulasnella calospora MUT 4182 TaxID=1051891 RepID=A0A0C3QME2_9AGAM|nr:hypothetical protein M407DRAFT_22771 [Tulasnella calospora MUT 4182]
MSATLPQSKNLAKVDDVPASRTATPDVEATLNGERTSEAERPPPPPQPPAWKGLRFWLVIIAIMVATFLSAIELTSVSTALPTIVQDLDGSEFAWVGSAFALGSTAILPLVGGLAQIFGRRPVVLGSIAFFALGSGLCGGAKNMDMLIAGRAIQGVGSGGILATTEIVVADLVPLSERGNYMGISGAVWALASAIGPPVGGAFSQSNWRWLFYMNLPLTAIAAVLVWFCLTLKVPQGDLRTKMRRMDWTGNAIVIASTTSTVVALAWAGVKHSWGSAAVLAPLIIGLVGTALFFLYIAVFLHGIVSTAVLYYLPVYFQASLEQGPVKSGVTFFGNAFTIDPGAMSEFLTRFLYILLDLPTTPSERVCGATAVAFNMYRPQNYVGWALTTVGIGLLSLLKASSSKGMYIGFQIVEGFGLGVLYTAPQFPVLASIPVTETAHALAFFTFVRSYAQTWGVTIGATILQNELKRKLPQSFVEALTSAGGHGVEFSYAAIPAIRVLEEPVKTQVKEAFASSLRIVWLVMAALAALGTVTVFGMKELRLHEVTDEDWGLKEKKEQADAEQQAAAAEKVKATELE